MTAANVSESQVTNKDKTQGKGHGKPRVRNIKSSELQEDKERADRPHEVIEETKEHTITQLRSGTRKIVRH